MKKLLALLMALCMLAGVTAAFAEDTAEHCPRNSARSLLILRTTRMS